LFCVCVDEDITTATAEYHFRSLFLLLTVDNVFLINKQDKCDDFISCSVCTLLGNVRLMTDISIERILKVYLRFKGHISVADPISAAPATTISSECGQQRVIGAKPTTNGR
jgi:hypothetical protein